MLECSAIAASSERYSLVNPRPTLSARSVEASIERDGPLREGAGLIGEQHRDVAEVFDGDQPFDEDVASGKMPRPGGETDTDDGRQQLGSNADGDRQ